MTGLNGIYADPHELIAVLQQLVDEYPESKVEKNAVGNLCVIVFRPTAECIGWIDLTFPALNYYDDDSED